MIFDKQHKDEVTSGRVTSDLLRSQGHKTVTSWPTTCDRVTLCFTSPYSYKVTRSQVNRGVVKNKNRVIKGNDISGGVIGSAMKYLCAAGLAKLVTCDLRHFGVMS